MKIDIEMDEETKETRVVIYTNKITEKVQEILSNLKRVKQKHLVGIKEEKIYILNPDDIFYFYSESGKVFAQMNKENYEVKDKLYKLEEFFTGTFL